MARPLDKEIHEKKRNDILDVVLELVYSKGYDQFSVQDVRDKLGISSGAFHHYFKSRAALLESLVDRIKATWTAEIYPIVSANDISAIDKLQKLLMAFNEPRNENKAAITQILQAWYSEHNNSVRQRIDAAKREVYSPLLIRIIQQGNHEGTFSVNHPDSTSSLIVSILQNMELAHAQLLLSAQNTSEEDILIVYASHIEAIERILKIQANSLPRINIEEAELWLAAMKQGGASSKT